MAAWLQDCETITGYENTGCAQSMYANRLSFFYDLHGPSMNIDTACSSALVALVQACQAIESGEIDMAIVGGSSITLHPGVRTIFMCMELTTSDLICRLQDNWITDLRYGIQSYPSPFLFQVSVAFRRLRMLSPNSACQSFSKNGDGYARAEGVAVVVRELRDRMLKEGTLQEPLVLGGTASEV